MATGQIILRVPSPPFAEHVLFKNVALNDYFPSPNVEPRPSKLWFSDKNLCTFPPPLLLKLYTLIHIIRTKLLSAVLFTVATDLKILHNRESRGSNRGLVATINVTKIATNLSYVFK